MRNLRRSPGIIVAVAVLVLATTGSAVGAALVTGKQVKNGTLTGADVQDGSLSAADLRGSAVGVGRTVEALGPVVPTAPGGTGEATVASSKAECPAGTVVTGGGFEVGVRDFIGYAGMSGNGYFVIAINTNEFDGSSVQANAVCGARGASPRSTPRAVAAASAAERDRLRAFRARLAG